MNLYGLTLDELQEITHGYGWPRYTARQIASWMYAKACRDFEGMSNLSKIQRRRLKEDHSIFLTEHSHVSQSQDGTKKYLYPYGHSRSIETAYIPEEERATLCVSSQVGCKMGCLFCMTAKQGFQGNLSPGEIVGQYAALPERKMVTNFVYMGMGEPLDNLDSVLKSLEILTADWDTGSLPKKSLYRP
jgi:23S rRNA (adenine2503-C2)-methyltransferase